MARTQIPVTTITRAGIAPSAGTDADMTDGMYIAANNGRIYVEIVSTDAGAQTVGFEIPTEVDGIAVDDKVVTIPAGATRKAGPWPTGTYNQEDDSINVNPSIDGATLKISAYKLPTES
jgi:hypothetical protein